MNGGCNEKECPLWRKRTEVPYEGNVKASMVWLGESPGTEEEKAGRPFYGRAGKLHKEVLNEVELKYSDFMTMNSARCLIDKKKLTAREQNEILSFCRPKVERVLHTIKPKGIVLMGDFALRQITKKTGITKLRGRWSRSEEFNCWVYPVFHPAHILRNPGIRGTMERDYAEIARFIANTCKPPETDKGRLKGYKVVESIKDVLDLSEMESLVCSVDTEGNGIDWMSPNFLTISFSISWAPRKAYQIFLYAECEERESNNFITVLRSVDGKKTKEPVKVYYKPVGNLGRKLRELRVLLENPKIKKTMMHGNFDLHATRVLFERNQLIPPEVQNFALDVQYGAHVLDENMFKMASLEEIQMAFTDVREDYKREFDSKPYKEDMLAAAVQSPEEFTNYACTDADVTRRAGISEAEALMKTSPRLVRYVKNLVMPSLDVFREMEMNGALIDQKALPGVRKEIEAMRDEAHRLAMMAIPRNLLTKNREKILEAKKKDKFPLSMNGLVADVFFAKDGFRLQPVRSTKTGLSVDKNVRKALMDRELPPNVERFILSFNEFSETDTMVTRYLNGFENWIRSDGRIHSNYSTTTVVTGRSSSRNPNFQNNPKRSKLSKEIRKLIMAPKGYVLMTADQSQSELRWLAELSGDEEMIRVFAKGEDIHTATALELRGLCKEEWDSYPKVDRNTWRRSAKIVNFGVIYLMSPRGLVQYAFQEYGIKISEEEAARWIAKLFHRYPRIKTYHRKMIEFGRDNGYVESPLGRRRRLPELRSDEDYVRMEAERQAVNSPIQSVSSDVVIKAAHELYKRKYPRDEFRLIMFVHDELVWEVRKDLVEKYAPIVKDAMENPPLLRDFNYEMRVPLVAEIGAGKNLAEIESLNM